MKFSYRIDADLELELQSPEQSEELFTLLKANQAFIGEHMGWAKRVRNIEDFRLYMQRDFWGMADGRRWAWLIRYQGQAAGRIGIFVTLPEIKEAELNYWLAERFTGKGIMTRAARVITNFAFATLQLEHVLIGFSGENPKSGAVAERLGYKKEYVQRKSHLHDDIWHDLHFWGISSKEWQIRENPGFEHQLRDGLALRLHQIYDVPRHYALLREHLAEFSAYFWWANQNYSLEREEIYARRVLAQYGEGDALMLGIWQDGELVGNVLLSLDPEQGDVLVAYWLAKTARNKGIMSRTLEALKHYSFAIRGMERFYLRTPVYNQASRRLAEKMGMKQEAILREDEFVNGRYIDSVVYSMLSREYFAVEKEIS